MPERALLGGLSEDAFLAEYWQKRPLLIRDAWPQPPVGVTGAELAGLALAEDVESRVVMGDTTAEDWMLLEGPFTEAFFSDTPDRDWTLLVQDLDKHLPAFGALLEPFRFVPDWRIDDLMASYAAPGGTVGPHRDSYDVFLLQGEGEREWRIQWPPPGAERLAGHPDLRLLADFEATRTWTLAPGDMLYLPPGVPHYGIATSECVTYSIGFRAPSAGELLVAWARECAARLDADVRYGDPDLRPQANPAELPPGALDRLRRLVRDHLTADDLTMDRWLGRHLTAPKAAFADVSAGESDTTDGVAAALAAGRALIVNPAVRMSLIRYDDAHAFLYAHGEEFSLDPVATALAGRVTATHRLTAADLAGNAADRDHQLATLTRWLDAGWLLYADELTE